MTKAETGLRMHGIGVRFGGLVALDDISFTVPAGKVVGVIGPNGAGKTTLFNVICGLVRPTSGSLSLDGRPLRPRPHRLNAVGIARTLQGVRFFRCLTVLGNGMVRATHSARGGFAAGLLALPGADRA